MCVCVWGGGCGVCGGLNGAVICNISLYLTGSTQLGVNFLGISSEKTKPK